MSNQQLVEEDRFIEGILKELDVIIDKENAKIKELQERINWLDRDPSSVGKGWKKDYHRIEVVRMEQFAHIVRQKLALDIVIQLRTRRLLAIE